MNEATRDFFGFVNKFVDLSEEEFDSAIAPYCTVRKFRKKESILRAGETENYFNFIHKGLVRKYFKRNNDELVTQVSTEGQIIQSQVSFYDRIPSDYFIESLEQTQLVSIDFNGLNEIFSKDRTMERLGRLIATHVLLLSDRWQMLLLKLSPRERFLNFVQNNPSLMQRVPQKILASLLNIQPETFSRFKHLLKMKES